MNSVKSYGAKGDGLNCDSDAFQEAVNAAKAEEEIFIPAGRYLLNRSIDIKNQNIRIRGVSPQSSQLFFTQSNGIHYETNNQFIHSVHLNDLSLISLQPGKYTAIAVHLPDNGGSPWKNCVIDNVTFAGAPSVAEYNDFSNNDQTYGLNYNQWHTSLDLKNCAGSSIRDIVVRGGRLGLRMTGDTTDLIVQGGRFFYLDKAIEIHPPGEGFLIGDCFALHVGFFVHINPNKDLAGGVYGSVRNCHTTYKLAGISAENRPQLFIHNNLFFPDGGDSVDIQLINCERCVISGNIFIVKITDGAHNGVVLSNSKDIIISGNIIQERDTGIWIRGNSDVLDKANLERKNNLKNGQNVVTEMNKKQKGIKKQK